MRQAGPSRATLEGGRLGRWQLVLLLVTIPAVEDGTLIDHWLARVVGVGGWISILLAVPVTLVGVLVLFALADRHPRDDLAQMLLRLTGPLAYPLGIAYAALFLADGAFSLREYGMLSRLVGFMSFTPYAIFAVGLMAVALYGACLGIEVVARVNAAVLLCLDIPLGILLALLSLNHQKLARALPVLAHGLSPVLWGSWLVVGKFGELVLLLVFLPLVAQGRTDARRATLWGVMLITVMALGHELGPVLTFGSSIREVEWPVYSQIRSIMLARFVANLDWVAVILWTHGFLIEITTFTYAASLTLASLFGMRSHRPLIPWLLAVVLAGSFFTGRIQDGVLLYRWMLDSYGFVAFGWVLPLLLLGLSLWRGTGTRQPLRPRWRRDAAPTGNRGQRARPEPAP